MPELTARAFTARLVAEGLISEARRSREHRRMYLTGHLGLTPSEVFAALQEHLHPDVEVIVNARGGQVRLQAVPLDEVNTDQPLLVPYHVGDPGPNSGSGGFAALLRDEVPSGPVARVLLILDTDPVETVRTAAEDASSLPSLQWSALLEAAMADARPAVLTLLRAVQRDDADYERLPRTADSIGVLRRLAAIPSPVEVGESLYLLRSYVADPGAHTAPAKRLRLGARWRDRFESWCAPDQDLEAKLRVRYHDQDDARLKRVLRARTPFGMDYSAFDLEDLPAERASAQPLRFASPIQTRGAACVSASKRAVVWRRGGGSFSVLLAAPAARASTATVRWSDGGGEDVPIAVAAREVALDVVGDGWRYATLELSSGSHADLAIFVGVGDWAPFEADVDIDVDASAFRCGDEPRVLAMGPTGALLGRAGVSPADQPPADGESHRCTVTLGTQTQPIDLLVVSADAGDGDWPPGDGSPGDTTSDKEGQGGGGEPWSEGGSQEPTISAVPKRDSVAHAVLYDSRDGQLVGETSFLVTGGVGRIQTPGSSELPYQRIAPGLDGLELEAQILAQPEVMAFVANRDAGPPNLERHPYLDRLDLGGLPPDILEDFVQARSRLFSLLAPHGSVHAIGAGVAVDVAHSYVDAYHRVLDAMLEDGRFRAEYERLLLCDAVADPASGEFFLAPSNPVTVSFLLALTEQTERWLPYCADVILDDLATCTPRYLLPTFALQGTWYESTGGTPLLWRRFRAQSQTSPGEHRPGYISRRIEHFLRVHPEYIDERQTLAITLVEPGDGIAVLQALRRVVRPVAIQPKPPSLPHLEVTIVSSSMTPTALEAVVSGSPASASALSPIDRALRDRVRVTRTTPDEHLPDFAHITFVFRSALERELAVADLAGRAGTLFVGGLAAAAGRHTEPGRNETTFSWGTFTGRSTANGLSLLVRKTLELVGAMPRDRVVEGRTRMPSTRVARTFLEELYDTSVWVVHLDKLLGLEAFTPGATGHQARYLIDYEDRADPAQPGLDAITATARVAPYRLALRQALRDIGRPTGAALDRILRLFNGVSGRWALDLVGANLNDLHEKLGLATAIASLQDLDGALGEDSTVGLILPLAEMLDAVPLAARPSAGRLCDDLLFVRIPLTPGPPRLSARLLEVKYRGATDPGVAGVAREQLEKAHAWLLHTFTGIGPGRLFRSRDLAELLRGAATRAAAFGLITIENRDALETALDHVARGEFEISLGYDVGGQRLHGDFISIEGESAVPAHRQRLGGGGLPLGHVRLGRPALQALAVGRPLPRPANLPRITYPGSAPPGEEPPGGTTTLVIPKGGSPPESGALQPPIPAEVVEVAGRLDAAFAKYQLAVEPFSSDLAQVGPSVIRYLTRPLGRLSINDVERRSRDIGREVAAPGEVQIGNVPGHITVDVPRSERQTVPLTRVLPVLDAHAGKPGALQFVVGVAPNGEVQIADLSRLPHLLVAGATGSGKSVFLRGLLVELLRATTPDQLHLLIIDPKRLDFAPFASAPHVQGDIISDPSEALERLSSTLEAELDFRQPILESAGVSSAAEYYEIGGRVETLPQLVILVDEFADLVLAGSDRKVFSELVQRYAQLTRAYGIFLVLATQRPSVDVITGSIKANLSARIVFSLPSTRDSMTVIDRGGAENLLGDGDLLFYRNGRVERLQAPLTTLKDVRSVLP